MDRGRISDPLGPIIDRHAQGGGVVRLILLGVGLAIVAVLLVVAGRGRLGEPLVLSVLGALAGVGVFFLFALVLGFIQLATRSGADAFSKNLADSLAAGLLVTDPEGRIVYANRAYGELLGVETDHEMASIESVFSGRHDASEIVYRLANAARAGEKGAEEFRLSSGLRSGDEGPRWFRLKARPLNRPGGGASLTVWEIADVTAERRRQEDTFQELQNAINYLDHAPAGFLSSELSGSIVYINATLADWLGIDLATFETGRLKLSDIVLGDGMALLRAVKPDHRGAKTTVIDLDLAKSNGTPLPVRLYHRVPVISDGAPGVTRTVVLNRMLGEGEGNALRDAEVRFTRFFNNTPVAIASLAGDGSVRRTNAPFQRMFAALIDRKGGVEALNYRDLASDNDRVALDAAWYAAVAGQAQIKPVDILVSGEKDADRFVRFFVSPVTGDDGGAAGAHEEDRVIVYAMDMTEQRALEEQFAQGQKMNAVGQLAGGVAHDFNNVLTAIIGFSDLLLANHRSSDPSYQDIMNIKQNANRAASLVRQLLAFSRRQTLRPQVLALGDVLSDLRMLLARLLGEKVDLQVVHGRDLWPVKADISQFEQVIVNLAVNARDAMPDGGKLTIRTANVPAGEVAGKYGYKGMAPADFVLIEVQDEGTGMSEAVMEKIFDPFFSTKEVGKGTGLGLSTVHGVVNQTGGYIFPESELGKGTTFRVFLPRHIETENERAENQAAAAAQGNAERKERSRDLTGSATLLLVEDEDAVRAFAIRALSSRGYVVHEASSGVEALNVMQAHGSDIDLVVSDVVMPEMDGPTLFRELRKDHPDLKFIFMSGYAEEAFAKNLPDIQQQKFGFLPKPFTLKQLATAVKDALDE